MSLKICEIFEGSCSFVQMQPGWLVANLASLCEKMVLLATCCCQLDIESEFDEKSKVLSQVSSMFFTACAGLRQRLRGNAWFEPGCCCCCLCRCCCCWSCYLWWWWFWWCRCLMGSRVVCVLGWWGVSTSPPSSCAAFTVYIVFWIPRSQRESVMSPIFRVKKDLESLLQTPLIDLIQKSLKCELNSKHIWNPHVHQH